MEWLKSILGGNKPENENFRKVCDKIYDQKHLLLDDKKHILLSRQYEVSSEFFINTGQNIAYMEGKVNNISFSVPHDKEIEDSLKEELEELDDKKILAYSVCYEGTEILTGNFGLEIFNEILGGIVVRIPEEISIDGLLLRNVTDIDLDKILRSHKTYIHGLEMLNSPNLAEKLAEKYENLSNYFGSV